MSNPKGLLVACMNFVCIGSLTASAAELQHWSVEIVGDTAILHATKDTEYKFVKATITALQESGTERFRLRDMKPDAKLANTKLMYSIRIIDDTAEITASTDLPYKYLETTIRQLKESGTEAIKIISSGESKSEAASQR